MHQMIIHDETTFDLTPIFPPKTHPKIAFKSQNAKQTVFKIVLPKNFIFTPLAAAKLFVKATHFFLTQHTNYMPTLNAILSLIS